MALPLDATQAPAKLPADAHIGRVQLRVSDLERSLGFYRDLLGLQVARNEGSVITLVAGEEAEHADAPVEPRELIVLREVPGLTRRPSRPVSTGLYHAALLVPSRAALGRAILGLDAAGYPLRGMSDHAVSESLYLDDPDGNGLEIYADRPRSEWRSQNGEIFITTEPMDLKGVVAAAGERPGPWRGLPRETVVGHVHFTVSDLKRAVAFYHGMLGFDVTLRWPTLAGVAAGGYHHHLNLNTWAGGGAPRDSEQMAGLDSWQLVIPDDEARQDLAGRLTAAGAAAEPGNGLFRAQDPDGITVEII